MDTRSGKGRGTLLAFLVLLAGIFCTGSNGIAADCKAIAENLRKEQSLVKKRDLLAGAIKECAGDPEINYMYGYSLERLRKYDEALKYYNNTTALDKKNAKAFFSMADIYLIQDKVADAVAAYEKGLSLAPGDRRAEKSLESARIKLKALRGESVSSEEAVAVLMAEKSRDREVSPVEATILRLLVLFPGGSAELPEEGADQLSLVAARALSSPELKGAVFEVAGNTDDSGDAAGNMDLSRKRAEVVRHFLVKNFNIDARRLQVAAHGQSQPIVPNTTEQNRSMNNRVEFKRIK
ncbi:OmpA family protein [Thiovibrio sp. JS02]